MKDIALVLSGGGSRGAIQLGVLHAFDEYNIKIDAISGTSIGAIIGSLYCAGVKPIVVKELMESNSFVNIFHPSWNLKGLMNMKKLYNVLEEYIPNDNFNSLKIPMHICVSNINTNKYEIFNKGRLFDKIAASASIPVVFEPVKIDDDYYVDGGLINNLPIDPFIGKYKTIIGININKHKNREKHNMWIMAQRIIDLVIIQNSEPNFDKCDYLINPFINFEHNILNFNNTDKFFELGYAEGLNFVKTVLKQ